MKKLITLALAGFSFFGSVAFSAQHTRAGVPVQCRGVLEETTGNEKTLVDEMLAFAIDENGKFFKILGHQQDPSSSNSQEKFLTAKALSEVEVACVRGLNHQLEHLKYFSASEYKKDSTYNFTTVTPFVKFGDQELEVAGKPARNSGN